MRTVILAGGKGTRMESDLPKVLVPLHGRPMIEHLLESIRQSNHGTPPVLVVGYDADVVRQTIGEEYTYVTQEEQLGTAHAVQVTEEELKGQSDDILVLYGDHPLVSAETINSITDAHEDSDSVLTMATTVVPDFDGWRECFYHYGRVVRDSIGRVRRIVERKDASEEEQQIKEVNPSYFCFDAAWLWQTLPAVDNDNAQNEYYLTDLLGLAIQNEEKVTTVQIDPMEAMGANTKDQLRVLENIAKTVEE